MAASSSDIMVRWHNTCTHTHICIYACTVVYHCVVNNTNVVSTESVRTRRYDVPRRAAAAAAAALCFFLLCGRRAEAMARFVRQALQFHISTVSYRSASEEDDDMYRSIRQSMMRHPTQSAQQRDAGLCCFYCLAPQYHGIVQNKQREKEQKKHNIVAIVLSCWRCWCFAARQHHRNITLGATMIL